MTRQEWEAACVVRECPWSQQVWQGPIVVGVVSGKYRVVTPDGVDRPARGNTPAEAIASIAHKYGEE